MPTKLKTKQEKRLIEKTSRVWFLQPENLQRFANLRQDGEMRDSSQKMCVDSIIHFMDAD